MNQQADQIHIQEIHDGSVLDHIPTGTGLKLLQALKFKPGDSFGFANNVTSKRKGAKDLLTISRRHLTEEEVRIASLLAPGATLNDIQNGRVIRKFKLLVPQEAHGILTCPNPNCVTNHDRGAKTHFTLTPDDRLDGPYHGECRHCERTFTHQELAHSLR